MTPVIFRKFKDNGAIIALFPTLPGTRDPWTCCSYMPVGQHGAASVELFYEDTRPVAVVEHQSLFRELVGQGYDDLRVYTRYQPWFTKERLKQLNN